MSRELVLRLQDDAVAAWDLSAARALVSHELSGLLSDGAELDVEGVFNRGDAEALTARGPKPQQTSQIAAARFGRWYFVDVGRDRPADEMRDVAKAVGRRRDVVRRALVAPDFTEPTVLPTRNPLWANEGHFGEPGASWTAWSSGGSIAPANASGTNAWYAWRFPGGDGSGMRFVDIERGWDVEHPDLAGHDIQLVVGRASSKDEHVRHGTSALAVVCARDGAKGWTVGAAPRVSQVMVASYRRGPRIRRDFVTRLEKTIQRAAGQLAFGDVLLLEVEIDDSHAPVETFPTVYGAIQSATDAGVVVVEPAGNGGFDIDPLSFGDSGAIVVGSADGRKPHDAITGSNFGDRVDCWSWGSWVTAADHQDPPADPYTARFGGTSAASAIVAGIALSVQGARKAALKRPLPPPLLRDLLSRPALASVEPADAPANLGMQPDVRKVLDAIGLPFPWIRDSAGDTGESGLALTGVSPDIALRAPGAAVGTPPFAHDALSAGDPAELHVRVCNDGTLDAEGVEIDMFWRKPASGLDFAGWMPLPTLGSLGSLLVIDVIPGKGFVTDTSLAIPELPEDVANMDLLAIVRHDPSDLRLPSGVVPKEKWRMWLDQLRTTAYRLANGAVDGDVSG